MDVSFQIFSKHQVSNWLEAFSKHHNIFVYQRYSSNKYEFPAINSISQLGYQWKIRISSQQLATFIH